MEEVSIFDVYKGAQVPEGMKSVAFALSFRALDRTLKDEDVNVAMDRILKNLEKALTPRDVNKSKQYIRRQWNKLIHCLFHLIVN